MAKKNNRKNTVKELPRTRWQNGYEYRVSYTECDSQKQFDDWAKRRQEFFVKYDDRCTFVWLSRHSFEFDTSNGTLVVVSVNPAAA